MHDCMNRRQTPRCENIHLAADVSDKSPTSRAQPSFGGRTRAHPRTAAGYRAYATGDVGLVSLPLLFGGFLNKSGAIYKHIKKNMSWLQGHSTVPKS